MRDTFYMRIILSVLYVAIALNAAHAKAVMQAHTKRLLVNEPDNYLIRCEVVNNVTNRSFIYGTSNDTYCNDLTAVNDGYLVVGSSAPFDKDPFLLSIDSDGYENWRSAIRTKGVDEILFVGLQTRDGGYLAAGTSEDINGDGTYKNPYLLRVNNFGKKLWDISFKKKGTQQVAAIYEADNGYIYMAGFGYHADIEDDSIWTAVVNEFGKAVSYKVVGSVSNSDGKLRFLKRNKNVCLVYKDQKELFYELGVEE